MTNRGRQLYCRRCEGHGKKNTLRGHGAVCPYIDCNCRSCSRLMKMRKSAFLRRYKEIFPESEIKSNTSMAEQLVSEYRLIDGTNPRLRFTNNISPEIAIPKPLKISDFKEDLMEKFKLSPPTTQSNQPLHHTQNNKIPSTTNLPQVPLGNFMNAPNLQNVVNFNQIHQNNQQLMNIQLPTSTINSEISQPKNGSAFMSFPNFTAFASLPTLPQPTNMINLQSFNVPMVQQPTIPQYNMVEQKPFLMQIPNSYQLAYFQLINSARLNTN